MRIFQACTTGFFTEAQDFARKKLPALLHGYGIYSARAPVVDYAYTVTVVSKMQGNAGGLGHGTIEYQLLQVIRRAYSSTKI